MSLANALSLSRLLLALLFVVALLGASAVVGGVARPSPAALVLALLMVIANLVTDYYDGALARRQKKVSDFGKLMDPVTDAAFYLSVFACYLYRGWMPLGLFVVLLARELFMNVSLRPFLAARGVVLAAGALGKAKTVVQGVVTVTLLVFEFAARMVEGRVPALAWWDETFLRVAALLGFSAVALLSVWSSAVYLLGARRAFAARTRPSP